MTIVQQHIDHLEAMKNSVEDVLREILVANKEEILNILKYGQLAEGINSYGQIIGRYSMYTQGYANAARINIPKRFGEPYNMYWSGETVENLKLKLIPKSYELYTVAGKQRLLESIYGEIFELTDEHNEYVNKNILEPNLIKWLEENWWKLL